ncbi:AAA-ATPase At3g28580-like [Zingiber officinale]|uniref:AAA-ATPase At3g28580-like n=1 Tax=Zingiber officinale TaxID=94328 RepID=UPI001C4BD718|nr:AAA-ATPase At3g28580-like [Zingiber officinale]
MTASGIGDGEKGAAALWSIAASAMFLWPLVYRYFPGIQYYLAKYCHRLVSLVSPYIHITFPEFSGERMKRSDAYAAIESYLAASCTQSATKLKAELGKDSSSLTLSMDEHEEVTDDFRGARIWWTSVSRSPPQNSMSFYPQPDSRRYFRLIFHRRHRDLVVGSYLDHVLAAGREATFANRRRKLYTNNPSNNWYGYKKSVWSHVTFTHPSTFATMAMDPDKKKEIVADLEAFRSGKDFYAKIGKPWKRGYLLYGPPGTGKSTMIAAIANYLDYDIYDLELTSVKDNTELRKLFIETTGKSIIVIEDIDCSLDLTGERKKKKDDKEDDDKEGSSDGKPPVKPPGDNEKQSKVTLSGLLNFIDGLWSACGGERLIIFTTNYVEKLDPALIRRGRMDKHIEMSYCCFEAFKVLAANYLGIVDGEHRLFENVRVLIDEVKMTPADVAENLMPKSGDGAESCLQRLIQSLEEAREKTTAKAEEGKSIDGTAESEVVNN